MAKPPVNKSQAIRDALRDHPDKSPKEIADMLAAEGMKVNAQYVSTIKSNAKIKSVRKIEKARPSLFTPVSRLTVNENPITSAAQFIRSCGGYTQACEALASIGELKDSL